MLVYHCCPKGNGRHQCSNETLDPTCKKQHQVSLGNTETLLVEALDFVAVNMTVANDVCGYNAQVGEKKCGVGWFLHLLI